MSGSDTAAPTVDGMAPHAPTTVEKVVDAGITVIGLINLILLPVFILTGQTAEAILTGVLLLLLWGPGGNGGPEKRWPLTRGPRR